ncbi:MAG: pilus assembly PilX N-terminal domain-containing protein [Deltaproteobacteria bacterium]
MTIRLKSEEGNLTIIAFVLLVILTVVGIFATKTAQLDLQTAYNEVPYKQNFYIAEGGLNREAAELGRGMYPVVQVFSPALLATHETVTGHTVLGKPYDFRISYIGNYAAPSGFSAIHFSRYDYRVDTWAGGTASSGRVHVASRLFKIGPKAE